MVTTYKIHPAIGVARLGIAPADPAKQEGYYLAPETEGALPSDPKTGKAVGGFRDAEGRLLKQAARFQVYAYDGDGSPGKPVTIGDGAIKAIEWTVWLANKKAAWYQFTQLTGSGTLGDKGYRRNGPELNPLRVNRQVSDRRLLILDPGPRTVGGDHPVSARFDLPPGPTTDPETFKPATIHQLGGLYAEAAGSLLVFGADGNSGTTNLNPADKGEKPKYQYAITSYSNNEGWFDDTADGPVNATLIMANGSRVELDPAWCLSAAPKYAPQIVNIVTLFDTVYDMAVRELGYRPEIHDGKGFNDSYVADFEHEIQPLLRRIGSYHWVADLKSVLAATEHGNVATSTVDDGVGFPLAFIRLPEQINDSDHALKRMPRLAGDNPFNGAPTPSVYLTLTATQIFLLTQYSNGTVKESIPGRDEPPGVALDHGVLRNCVGGAFCPGIEMTWICRDKHIYAEPFRIRARKGVAKGQLHALNGDDNLYVDGVEPGDLTKYMAQPWQGDFNECSSEGDISGQNEGKDWWWWPAQRPVDVYPEDSPGAYAEWTRGYTQDGGSSFSHPVLGDMQMVVDWQNLGFVVQRGDKYLETERRTGAIEAYKDPVIPAVA